MMQYKLWFDLNSLREFIDKNGDPYERVFADALVDENSLEQFKRELAFYQNEDGGWIRLDADYKGNISSITCTIAALSKLSNLGIRDELYTNTLKYLSTSQYAEGCWDEKPRIIKFRPPKWFYPNNVDNRAWFTNGLIRYLSELGGANTELLIKGKKYIRSYFNEDYLKGYSHHKWMSIITFSNKEDSKDIDLIQDCLKYLDTECENFDLYDLLWAMESFITLKMDRNESVVKHFFDVIESNFQQQDGRFITRFGTHHQVDLANRMIYCYFKYGLITKEMLKESRRRE